MFGRFRLGSAVTLAVSVCLLAARLFLLSGYDPHGLTQHLGGAAAATADPAAPASAWVVFATTDQATQIRTQHARLHADSLAPDAAALPGQGDDVLELRSTGRDQGEAVFTLAHLPAPACFGIGHVAASFDGRPPDLFAAEPSPTDTACTVKLAEFGRFLQALLNTQLLTLTPAPPGATPQPRAFHVAGLTWTPE